MDVRIVPINTGNTYAMPLFDEKSDGETEI